MNLSTDNSAIKTDANDWDNIGGFIRRVSEIPAYTPRVVSQQFVICTNGGSSRAYIYDIYDRTWKYTTLT